MRVSDNLNLSGLRPPSNSHCIYGAGGEGKWHSFRANEVRLQLHALAYNMANFLRTRALPNALGHWSLTSLRERLVKIGAKIVTHARYVIFQMAEVAVPSDLFQEILRLIAQLHASPTSA